MSRFLNSKTGKAKPVFSLLSPAPAASYQGSGQLAGTYGEAATVTRGSAKLCETSVSTVASVSSNKAAVEPRGVRIEAAHTNLILQSQAFDDAAWTTQGVVVAAPVVTPNAAIAPDGTMTADRVDFAAALNSGETSGIYQSIVTSAGAYTFSVWIKGVSGSGHIYWLEFDGSFASPQPIPFTTEWSRVSITKTLFASLSAATELGYSAAWTGGTGGPASVYMWGAQFETGPISHSYVPTTSGTVTCAKDAVSLASSALPLAAGSIETLFTPEWSTNAGATLLDSRDGSTNDSGVALYVVGADMTFQVGIDSGSNVTSTGLTWAANQTYRIRAQWGGGAMKLYVNEALAAFKNSGAISPGSHDVLRLGNGFGGSSPLDGYLSDLRFYA